MASSLRRMREIGVDHMSYEQSVWTISGATLSDKSALKEFGLTRQELVQAISRTLARNFQFKQQQVKIVA